MEVPESFIIKQKGETIFARFISEDTLRVQRRKIPERRTYPKRAPTRKKKSD
jgi:hypothetical protein